MERLPDKWPAPKREKTADGDNDVAGLDDVAAVRRVLEIAVLDALGRDGVIRWHERVARAPVPVSVSRGGAGSVQSPRWRLCPPRERSPIPDGT